MNAKIDVQNKKKILNSHVFFGKKSKIEDYVRIYILPKLCVEMLKLKSNTFKYIDYHICRNYSKNYVYNDQNTLFSCFPQKKLKNWRLSNANFYYSIFFCKNANIRVQQVKKCQLSYFWKQLNDLCLRRPKYLIFMFCLKKLQNWRPTHGNFLKILKYFKRISKKI